MTEEVRATFDPMDELAGQLRGDNRGDPPISPVTETGHSGLDQALAGFESIANQVCAGIDLSFSDVADGVKHEISNFSEADGR